ncbi:MAG: glutamine synthetase [Verrucomicrobiales bacterium]|jgi:glutamine synthetase
MEPQEKYVLRTVEERGVRLVRLWFTDVLGQHKSVAISPAELEKVFLEGLQFDGSSIDGFSRVQESDVLARPDATTFELLPWARDDEPSGLMFCNIERLDGSPFAGDPRQVLRRNLDRAHDAGFTFFVAPEMEFFYFESDDPTNVQPVDTASYFDLTTADVASDLRKTTQHMLEALSIPVEYSFHEDAPSQHEIDLQYTDALAMADSIMTFRLVVKKVAQERNVHATFMPKPLDGVQGSGMHTHMSLWRDGQNAFYDGDHEYGLSKTAQQFIAGTLRHAREITAVTNQLINSYKRLNDGLEAPRYVSWARNNQSTLVRVPVTKRNKPDATRIEFRSPDPACNPYLAFSLILAAGMKGIEENYDLQEETKVNLFDGAEAASAGVATLPRSLDEALDEMENSSLVRETLGEHIFEWFLRNRRAEWADYSRRVTAFELDRYLRQW